LLGFSEEEVDGFYDEVVEFAELRKFMDQKLKNYSSGMQVRLAFSMAVRANADILLIDEVLAVGDADFQRKCFEFFKTLKKNKKTVVFVSHDMNAIREYCDRVILVDKAKLIMSGSADKIATQYTKLFNTTEENDKKASQSNRWGDRKIMQEKVIVAPKVIGVADKEIMITVEYVSTSNIDNPVFGFRIKSLTGEPIMGTNTHLLSLKTGEFKAGKKGKVVWRIPNVFEDGKYTIDLAVSHSDGITQCDWWENAAEIISQRNNKTPYLVSPMVKVNL
jgi:ABC-2 type transport system ATP-binding protein